MIIKELIEQLKKYPEDTEIYIENHSDDFGLTFLEEPGIEFEEEVEYAVEKGVNRGRMYYAGLKKDGVLNNVLIIK